MNEIERKFLIDLNKLDISKLTNWTCKIEQGYLCDNIKKTIRIRVVDDKSYITIKGETKNITRKEFEYEIPYNEAVEILKICDKTIIKKRITINYDKKYWYIDIFEGENEGLVIGEIELNSENEKFNLPPWATTEVSNDCRYYNVNLINNPYNSWNN